MVTTVNQLSRFAWPMIPHVSFFICSGFSIADPGDVGMMDVVGFDTATPGIISGFSKL